MTPAILAGCRQRLTDDLQYPVDAVVSGQGDGCDLDDLAQRDVYGEAPQWVADRSGDHLWVANQGDSTLAKLDREGLLIDTHPVFSGPSPTFSSQGERGPASLAFDGNALWVAFPGDSEVTRLLQDGGFLTSLPVPGRPRALVLADGFMWIADQQGGTVTRADLDGALLGTLPVGQGPAALVYDGESTWVANSIDGTVARIDP